MIWGSTMHAPISKLGLLPLAVSVPLISMRSGAFANVNSMAQPQKISSRRSARTLSTRALGGASRSRRLRGAARHREAPQRQ